MEASNTSKALKPKNQRPAKVAGISAYQTSRMAFGVVIP